MHAILQDLRLRGIAPGADLNLYVDASNTLRDTWARLRRFALAQSGPITLDIMCHGFESHNDYVGRQSVVDAIGGSGLQLCKENLKHSTVRTTEELAGVVSTITVFACSAAETHPGYVGSTRDGQQLFREMSAHTGATIYAADATQWYRHRSVTLPNASASVIDFGGWEGSVWEFTPDGTVTLVERNPVRSH